ncbi:hypothetical protein EVAR_12362_1 [Eumeta japonica]|uniref:CUB domain-containing protein n=1 Tax=Eumeta variegata TaxID=151549 RepID=A0A4C1X0J7_EUMVA|nr:hypothetical protein EVAR_12362_1 [Eumeta japonica]
MLSRWVAKGTSSKSSSSEKDVGVPTLPKGEQKTVGSSKKFAKVQKKEVPPPSKKALQQIRESPMQGRTVNYAAIYPGLGRLLPDRLNLSCGRLTMQWLIVTLVATMTADRVVTQDGSREHEGPQPCGGHHYDGPTGVIQTPNFPDPFPVPIKCRWIIENAKVNGTISVYFTQQYTTSGLTFTEYLYYDDTYKAGERRALTVTDENITRVKWLQVSFLV